MLIVPNGSYTILYAFLNNSTSDIYLEENIYKIMHYSLQNAQDFM